MFNATLNNISDILWRPVLLVKDHDNPIWSVECSRSRYDV